jgi:hypothetical protein
MPQVRGQSCAVCFLSLCQSLGFFGDREATTKLSSRMGGDDALLEGCSCSSLEAVYTIMNRVDRYIGEFQLCRAEFRLA